MNNVVILTSKNFSPLILYINLPEQVCKKRPSLNNTINQIHVRINTTKTKVDEKLDIISKEKEYDHSEGKIKKQKIDCDEISKSSKVKKHSTKRNVSSRLVRLIKEVIKSEDPPPKKSIIKFENTEKAAEFNSKIIGSFEFDYEKFLSKQKDTTIDYGSEFRPVWKLQKLLKYHDNWCRLERFLVNGTDTVLTQMNEDVLKNDCIKNLERGNHKSASKSTKTLEFLQKTYSKEVRLGWMTPISIGIISKLKNACVIPVGVVSQWTIDEMGKPKEKMRLTHDCSWIGPSGQSVNSRIDESY